MNRYQKIQEILDRLVEGRNIGAHGAFWRGRTRDEFLQFRPFGFPLVAPNDPDGSNLVKALSGIAPFGRDQGTPGAFFNRMPSGMAPASEDDIHFIRQWIADGCPEDPLPEEEAETAAASAEARTAEQHNAYWREFDNWAMFNASPEIGEAIGFFFPEVEHWFAACHNPARLPEWEARIGGTAQEAALRLLSARQRQTVTDHYGDPIDTNDLFESYELFGRAELPDDPLRPNARSHRMDGNTMWFFWSAFADACLRLEIDADFWRQEARAILVGLLNDGLFRGRFEVAGFPATDEGKEQIKSHCAGLPDDPEAILAELAKRLVESKTT